MRRQLTHLVAGSAALALQGSILGANEKVTLALIGGRNQGRGDALRAIAFESLHYGAE